MGNKHPFDNQKYPDATEGNYSTLHCPVLPGMVCGWYNAGPATSRWMWGLYRTNPGDNYQRVDGNLSRRAIHISSS